jgi:hypothetical protein
VPAQFPCGLRVRVINQPHRHQDGVVPPGGAVRWIGGPACGAVLQPDTMPYRALACGESPSSRTRCRSGALACGESPSCRTRSRSGALACRKSPSCRTRSRRRREDRWQPPRPPSRAGRATGRGSTRSPRRRDGGDADPDPSYPGPSATAYRPVTDRSVRCPPGSPRADSRPAAADPRKAALGGGCAEHVRPGSFEPAGGPLACG